MNEENKNNQISVHEIDVSDIAPNPYQPRLNFDDQKLSSLADSVSRYGVMQPIVVTQKPDGKYELISGERRLRASKLAGKETIPAVVRDYEHSDEEKFELSIIENIQREDLSPRDKAKAFEKLSNQFGYTHGEIAQKMGKSREYISNALRLLLLPDEILSAMGTDALTEGHARPLLMLKDRPYEQGELFKKIVEQNLTVRAAEKIARSIATEKLRKLDIEKPNSEIKMMEKKLAEKLGTKVYIDEKVKGEGGKLTIEYFSKEDLEKIINMVKGEGLPELSDAIDGQNSGIEKFQENFSDENISKDLPIEKQVSQPIPAATVFASEIMDLEEKPVLEVQDKISNVKVNIETDHEEEKPESIDGYDISFNTSPRADLKEEVVPEIKEEEDILEDAAPENIDNFSTQNWREKERKINYQSEVDAMISERINPLVEENKEINTDVTPESEKEQIIHTEKQDITEPALNRPQETIKVKTSPIENIIVPSETQKISKDDFLLKKQDEMSLGDEIQVNKQENISEKGFGQKTEAQQRIDDILAGRKTVSEEYNLEKDSYVIEKDGEYIAPEQVEQKKEDITNTSVYQQFLESKKKIEEEKAKKFSGNSESGIDNAGNFSDNNSAFTENEVSNIESENESIEELKQENTEKEEENSYAPSNSGAKIEKIFGGSDFLPESESMPEKEDSLEKQLSDTPEDSQSFKGFSI